MDNLAHASFGRGSSILGGTGPLARAIAAHGGVGGSGGMQSQVSPASQIYNPSQQVTPPPPATGNAMTAMGSMSAPTAQPTPQPVGNPMVQQLIDSAQSPQSPDGAKISKTEAEKIVEALTGHLKHLEKSDMMKLEAVLPQGAME